jgi:hypothetical protein
MPIPKNIQLIRLYWRIGNDTSERQGESWVKSITTVLSNPEKTMLLFQVPVPSKAWKFESSSGQSINSFQKESLIQRCLWYIIK